MAGVGLRTRTRRLHPGTGRRAVQSLLGWRKPCSPAAACPSAKTVLRIHCGTQSPRKQGRRRPAGTEPAWQPRCSQTCGACNAGPCGTLRNTLVPPICHVTPRRLKSFKKVSDRPIRGGCVCGLGCRPRWPMHAVCGASVASCRKHVSDGEMALRGMKERDAAGSDTQQSASTSASRIFSCASASVKPVDILRTPPIE